MGLCAIARRTAANVLGRSAWAHWRWVFTERNLADEPSRRLDGRAGVLLFWAASQRVPGHVEARVAARERRYRAVAPPAVEISHGEGGAADAAMESGDEDRSVGAARDPEDCGIRAYGGGDLECDPALANPPGCFDAADGPSRAEAPYDGRSAKGKTTVEP